MLHVVMLVIVLGLLWMAATAFGYTVMLGNNLSMATSKELAPHMNQYQYHVNNTNAHNDMKVWGFFMLPLAIVMAINIGWAWYAFATGVELSAEYLAFLGIGCTFVFARTLTKNFASEWFVRMTGEVIIARNEFNLAILSKRLGTIAEQWINSETLPATKKNEIDYEVSLILSHMITLKMQADTIRKSLSQQ